MRKILSGIFSVVLATSTALTMTAAPQMAKKASAKGMMQTQNVAAKVATASQKAPGKKGFEMPTTRQIGSSLFSQQKTSATAPVKKAGPSRAEGVPTIYGVVTYANSWTQDNAPAGFYQVPTADGQDFTLQFLNDEVIWGGCWTPDFYVGFNFNYVSIGSSALGSYSTIDLENGEVIATKDIEDFCDLCSGCSYDPMTGCVYGISTSAEGKQQLARYEVTEEGYTKYAIADLEGDWKDTAIDNTGKLYAISGEGVLYTADKNTGAMTEIGSTGVTPNYIAGATFDQKTNRLFWSVSTDDGGYLYEVNTATGAAELLCTFSDGEEVVGIYIPAAAAADDAPAECNNVSVNFEDGSLSGTVNLTTPATLFDGVTPGSGELIVTVLANGEQVGYAEPQWNSQVSVPVDLSLKGAGNYTFTVFASNEAGEGPKTNIKNVWIGADTPEATSATLVYHNGNMEVSWLPVTSSVNGGYLDLDNLTYTVKNKDGVVVAEGLTATSFSEAVAEPAEITSFFYTVEVKCGDLVSQPAKTNTVVLGSIIPPYQSDFAADGLSGWTVINANEDAKTWTVNDDGSVSVAYNSSMAMDDWLITPPIKLEAGKAYEVAFQSKCRSTSFPERLEVMYGTSPDAAAMTSTLVEPTVIDKTEWIDFSKMLIPEADGIYFIGFHGISDANMFYLYLQNIQIKEGISAAAPGLASNLVATPDANGEKKCVVSFNAPDKTMAGDALSSLTKVELYRDGALINTFDAPAVGAPLSYNDVLEEGGNVTYSVIGYNEEGKGLEAKVSTFIGFDLPAAVPSATIATTATVGEVVCTWEAVTADINGLPLPESEVTYTVAKYEDGWVPVAEGLTGTSYSFQAVAEGKQDFVQLAVFAVNEAGTGEGAETGMIPVGTPYDGITESFPGATLNYIWGIKSINGGSVQLCDGQIFEGINGQDEDGGYVDIYSDVLEAGADFFSGLVSLEGMVNPGFTFYVYNIGDGETPNPNEISVSVKEAGSEDWVQVYAPKTVDDICGGELDSWGKVSVSLEAYANKTIQVQITAIVKDYIHNFIDNIKVGSILGHDLKAASISAPAKANCGSDYTVDVKVANEGAQAADAYVVELYADEELVASEECENLASGTAKVVTFNRSMSPLATEPVSYYAKVVYAADENEANNQTASLTVTPVVSKLPVATDLEAVNNDGSVKLTWNEPNLEGGVAEEKTDDFEDADAFAAEYGNWTFVDVDGSAVGGFQGLNLPGITSGTTTGSFWIWDQETAHQNLTFDAHSGNKYLFALYRFDDGQTDDWAISPELYGGEQTVSFYAKSYDAQYPEKIAVYYSTGSLDPNDFVLVDDSEVASVPADWTQYSVNLPEGAKHFAIRSYAEGSFMLMVDDVTYTPADAVANLEIAGYNVYRDGVKINDALVEDTEFIDNNVVEGEQYTYVVTVVYTGKGESAASNESVITVSGVEAIGAGAVAIATQGHNIVILNALDMNVSVVAANGAVIYSGIGNAKTTVAAAPGVYVVKAGKTVKKVIVK